MDKRELEQRTRAFSLRVIRFVGDRPKNKVTDAEDIHIAMVAEGVNPNGTDYGYTV